MWGPLCLNFLPGTPCCLCAQRLFLRAHQVTGVQPPEPGSAAREGSASEGGQHLGVWRSRHSGSSRRRDGGGGNGPQVQLFALKGALGSGTAFPVLGNCPCHLPVAVGCPSLRRSPSRGAAPWEAPHPGPHLCPPFVSPRQAFSLGPLKPPASFPTTRISPRPPHHSVTSKGVNPLPPPRTLHPSPFLGLALATL